MRTGKGTSRGVCFSVSLIAGLIFTLYPDASGAIYYYGKSYNLPIPAPDDPDAAFGRGAMQDALFNIADHRTIHNIVVDIGITHGSLVDCEIALVSPAGTRLILQQAGDLDLLHVSGMRQLRFDDTAALVPDVSQVAISMRPVSPYTMADLNGQDPYGTWKIQITDTMYGDTGTLNYARMTIVNPEPASLILIALGGMLMRVNRKL